MKVEGRIALITGSGSGIGKATAKRLVELGAKVIINDIDEAKVDRVVKEIQRFGGEVIGFPADVTNNTEVRNMFDFVKHKLGTLDILVNNVGIAKNDRIDKVSEDDWDRVIDVSLKSCYLCSHYASKHFIRQRYGRIINISSRLWLGGFGQTGYSAAKGGIVSLTRTWAIELAEHQVTVNCVAPGVIQTPVFDALSEDVRKRLLDHQPIGRFGYPEEVANAVAFFASDNSSYITGQVLHVCGGKSLGFSW